MGFERFCTMIEQFEEFERFTFMAIGFNWTAFGRISCMCECVRTILDGVRLLLLFCTWKMTDKSMFSKRIYVEQFNNPSWLVLVIVQHASLTWLLGCRVLCWDWLHSFTLSPSADLHRYRCIFIALTSLKLQRFISICILINTWRLLIIYLFIIQFNTHKRTNCCSFSVLNYVIYAFFPLFSGERTLLFVFASMMCSGESFHSLSLFTLRAACCLLHKLFHHFASSLLEQILTVNWILWNGSFVAFERVIHCSWTCKPLKSRFSNDDDDDDAVAATFSLRWCS